MNKCKTRVMIVEEQEKEIINIEIEDTDIEQLKNYKYLRVNINKKERQKIDINGRIKKTLIIYYAINKIEITKTTKMNVFKTIYRLIF